MHPSWWAARAKLGRPGRPSPFVVWALRSVARPLARIAHRAVLEGVENLPAEGPFLLIANHSGGVAFSELISFAALYVDQVGADRPLAGFAHPFMFHVWPVSAILRGLGAIPSTYAAAETALSAGIPLLVFPGGDYEGFRPIWQAYRVDFGGRVGFLRMARKARIPIVPLGIRGSHFTAPILWRSRWVLPYLLVIPRLAGVKRYPLTLLGVLGVVGILYGVHLALPFRLLLAWAWLASSVPPLLGWIPWTIRMRLGAPISPEELFGSEPTDAELPQALKRVEAAVQGLVSASR